METRIFVRYAEPADALRLGRIMAVSFRTAFAGFISRETLESCAVEENCAELLGGILREGTMRVLLGGIDDEPMGLLVWSEGENGRMEIEAIHSLPESWGSGLGESMLDFALDETGKDGASGPSRRTPGPGGFMRSTDLCLPERAG